MAKGKGIFENERRELPGKPYVTLTEALTWIVAGDCRSDNYLAEMWHQQGDQNQREWGSRYGPGSLLRHLELLTKGEEWQFDEAVGEEDRQSTLSQFEKAKDWLAANGADPAATYKRVKDRCDRDNTEAARFEACEEMIFNACAAREVELHGIRYDDATGKWDGVQAAIPYTYFLKPVFYRIGFRPEGASWGYLAEADLTPATRPEYDDIERDESRPAYRNVLIRRDHVVQLKKRFQDRRAESKSRQFSGILVERWYRDRVRNWNPAEPLPTEDADLAAAQQEFVGLTRDAFREIRRRMAPPEWLKQGPRRRPNARK